jgi:hypothetical protein
VKDKKLKKPSKRDLIEVEWPTWDKINLELQDMLFLRKCINYARMALTLKTR